MLFDDDEPAPHDLVRAMSGEDRTPHTDIPNASTLRRSGRPRPVSQESLVRAMLGWREDLW